MPLLSEEPDAYPRIIPCTRSMEENSTGHWRTLRPSIDAAACTGCLICWKFCPEACVRLVGKVPEIDLTYCKGCGICVAECPARCMAFEPEPAL